MNGLKVLFVGIGSIAKRHIRNLHFIAEQEKIKVYIDAFRRHRSEEGPAGIRTVYTEINSVPDDYDVIFVTNPTEKHLETLNLFHNKGNHFFIEKPVVSVPQIEDAKNFIPRQDSLYYVACPLRYNAVIQWIKNTVDPKSVISIRSISSSYLPDWRPGQDYRRTYSAHREMGGGVSIDLIHEWDYLTYLFGWPEKIKCLIGKKSHLEIDSDDFAIYIAEYPDKILELHLDYFGRNTIREIQMITVNGTIIGDIANSQIRFLNSHEVIDFQKDRDDYQRKELDHFIKMVNGTDCFEDGFQKGIKVLELTQGYIMNHESDLLIP